MEVVDLQKQNQQIDAVSQYRLQYVCSPQWFKAWQFV